MKKHAFTIVTVTLIFLGLLGFIPVTPKFSDAYSASCVVSRSDGVIGSGVLLDSGYVVTNKHVVDEDKNGAITFTEKTGIWVRFFEPASVHSATILDSSEVNWLFGLGGDYAVLKVDNPPKSKIRLMNREQFRDVKPGRLLYCIGATDGESPPHITFGPRSSDDEMFFSRAGLSAYFGNSGGGIFTADTTELIGLSTRVHIATAMSEPQVLPDWVTFTPSHEIREFISKSHKEVLVSNATTWRHRISWAMIIGGAFGLTLSVFGYNSCKEMRGLFRSDAS